MKNKILEQIKIENDVFKKYQKVFLVRLRYCFLKFIAIRQNLYIATYCFLFLVLSFYGYSIKQTQAESVQTATSLCDITKDLKLGMTGNDVKELQKYLNNNSFPLAETGIGSKGKETIFFGTLTQSAVSRFQKANNISTIHGVFDSATRDYFGCVKFKFTKDLKLGMTGNDVKELQKYLNNNSFPLAETGIGSKGKETTFFGTLTQNALKRFQVNKLKISLNEAGNFQVSTRSYINSEQIIPRIDNNVMANKLVTANFPIYYSFGGGGAPSPQSNVLAPVQSSSPTSSTPPVLSNGSPSGTLAFNSTSTTISVTTDKNASCAYSTSPNTTYNSMTVFNTTGNTSHSSLVSGLSNSGSYVYYVKCRDTSANTNTDDYTISFTVAADTVSPTISLDTPLNNATVSGSSVSLTADASDDVSVSGVQFKLDTNTNIGAEDTTSPYGVTWDSTSVADGSHTLIAVARDGSGNYATSSVITVIVDNTAPVISSISSGTPGNTDVTITWTTNEVSSSRVDYGTDTAYGLASTSAALVTSNSITLTDLSPGTTYHFRVQSVDAQGNTATSSDETFTTAESAVAMLVETGSYIGTGDTLTKNIDSSFKPGMVFVMPANTDPIMWRNRTVWHGRTQYLTDLPSAYAIGSRNGKVWEEFDGAGFTSTGNANKSGVVYHWIAFNDNYSGSDQSSSWVGNAINPRSVKFTEGAADLMFIKRDSSRPAIFRWKDADIAVSGKFQDGATTSFMSIDNDGVTVTDAVTVNQNSNTALGEGIEGVGFYDGPTSKLVTYIGDGTSNRLISTGFEPNAAMILDGVNDNTADTKHNVFITDTMTEGEGKPFGATDMVSSAIGGLRSDGVRLANSDYNVLGRKYAILAFKNKTTNIADEESFNLSVSDNGLINNGSTVTLNSFPALSGTSTLEFFGRPQHGLGDRYIPLVMLGSAPPGTRSSQNNTYNGGIYLYSTDPDSNGWLGPVLRIIHSSYLSLDRTEGSINYYNLNTGVTIPLGKDIHILVTHNGIGHWQIYVNGKKVKDYNLNLNQATYGNRVNGGTGVNKTTTLLSGATATLGNIGVSGRAYNVAAWNGVELTREQVQDRYQSFLENGENYNGPNPDKEYDFTGSSMPANVNVVAGGATLGPWTATRTQTPFFLSSGNSFSQGVPAVQTNGDVVVTTSAGDTNGRTLFRGAPSGKQSMIRTKLSYNNASRIILRSSDDLTGMTASTTIFDLTGTGQIDRTDTVTLSSAYLHYIGITSEGQSFIIHPETSVTWE